MTERIGAVVYKDTPDARQRFAELGLDTDFESTFNITLNGTDTNGQHVVPRFVQVDNFENIAPVVVTINGIKNSVAPYTRTTFEIATYTPEIGIYAYEGIVKIYISEARLGIGDGSNELAKDGAFNMGTYYNRDGSAPMLADVDMGGQGFRNVKDKAFLASAVSVKIAKENTVERTGLDKFSEIISVRDFGAKGDDVTDDTAAIQKAIDSIKLTGGSVYFPVGTYRISAAITLYSNIHIFGRGQMSIVHTVNTTRADAFRAIGTIDNQIFGIRVENLSVVGDAQYSPDGTPSTINGNGFNFWFVNDSRVVGCWISGFQDGGVFFLDGNYNRIENNRIRYTAQGCGHNASLADTYGNTIIGNVISDTGTYNGAHCEGSFGDGPGFGNGVIRGTVIMGNTIRNSAETGLNIENAPYTTCVGNTVIYSGHRPVAGNPGGYTYINMGIKVFGSPGCTVQGNMVRESKGVGIMIGANSGYTNVTGNTTLNNDGGSLLVTGSARPGGELISATVDVTVGPNSWGEDAVTFEQSGFSKPVLIPTTQAAVLHLRRYSATKRNTQVIFQNTIGPDVWRVGVDVATDNGTPNFDFFYEGNVPLTLTPSAVVPRLTQYADNAAAVAAGLPVNALYKLADGSVKARI